MKVQSRGLSQNCRIISMLTPTEVHNYDVSDLLEHFLLK